MKSAHEWFAEYAESHQNPTNKLIHWICVPLIFYSIIGILASFSMGLFNTVQSDTWYPYLHLGSIGLVLALIFYIRLSPSLAIGLALFSLLCLWAVQEVYSSEKSLLYSSSSIFIAAWLGQFYGHKIEGKKPSFFKDLQFLLIGPAWLMHFVYKKWNITY